MKNFYLKSFITALLLLCSSVASAYDFEVDGIYYNITDATAKTVAVTYKGEYFFQYPNRYNGAITIPSTVTYNGTTHSVTSIGLNAFQGCYGITSITIPNSVTSIGDQAFAGCTGLTSITIPNSVTSIGLNAFAGCTGLTSITIPNSVTSIGNYAFYGCSGITSITIPNSVTSIGNYAFYGCTGLTSIIVASGNTKYDSRNNCNAIIETASNTLITGCKNTIIPNSVTSIGSGAFGGCDGLTSVTIPNSVTSIGSDAFSHCTGLTSVTIPNSVTSIGYQAFAGCDGLTSVTIGNSVTSIGDWAFLGCSGITSITSLIPAGNLFAINWVFDVNKNTCTLYVRAGAKAAYRATDGWDEFTNIVEMEPVEDPEEERLVGDIDGDGSIDIADVTALVEIILGTKQ